MAHVLDKKCTNCGTCANECPVDALTRKNGEVLIDQEKSIDCGCCWAVCPEDAIELDE